MKINIPFSCLPRRSGRYLGLAGVSLALGFSAVAEAQTAVLAPSATAPAPTSRRFDIPSYVVSGQSALGAAQLKDLLAPYTGSQKSADDVNAARVALQAALARAGQRALVMVPEQTAGGPIRLDVTGGDSLVLKGSKVIGATAGYSQANIEASLPALKNGQPVDESRLERNLRLANLNPGKRTSVELEPQGTGGDVNANVTVTAAAPLRGSVSLDNTGDAITGHARLGLGISHSNLTGHDDVLSAQFITSPSQPGKVQVFGLNYSVPLYDLNSQIEVSAAHANSKVGLVQNLFNVSGQGTSAGVRWNYLLPATGSVNWKASVAYDWRQYKNDVTFAGAMGSLLPDVTVNPLTIGLAAADNQAFGGYGSMEASLAYSSNLRHGSSNAATFAQARAGAQPDYSLWKYALGVTLRAQPALASWGAKAQLSGQSSSNVLVYGEQFGLGGMNSVRGYGERQFNADSGYSLRSEVFSANLAQGQQAGQSMAAWAQDIRLKAFADVGYGKRNQPLPGEMAEFRPASMGLGLYVLGQQGWSLTLDVARALKTLGTRNKGDVSGHVSAIKVF